MRKTLACIVLGCCVAMIASPASAQVAKRIAHLEIRGQVSEAPVYDPFGLASSKAFTTRSLIERLRRMRHDDSVSAVFITFENASMGLGQIQELRAAIKQLKMEKEVYIHLDSCYSNALYWLASSASKIAMVPTGDLWLTGLYGEQLFLKDFLSNMHMQADVIHIGDYKSAGEILSRNEPSEALAEMIKWLYDDLYDQLLSQIAEAREMKKSAFEDLVDNGPYTAEAARAKGLIDEVAYRLDFVDHIKARHGDIPFDKNYGKDSGPALDLSNPMAIFNLFSEMMSRVDEDDESAVALIYVVGMIVVGDPESGMFGGQNHGASSPLRKALYQAARDPAIRAVVLRVDSGGGSATASEIIWHASREVVASGKPLIVSMGNVAGSGGYYVSCGADTIFAEPGTITGSIGVVGLKMVTRGFWEWIGWHWHPVKRGANADIMATDQPFTERGRAKITGWMEEIYEIFKSRVLEKRGERLSKPIEELAGGRVYTGRQALELGLVDRLGGLEDALRFAALEANLGDEYDVRVLPRPKTLFDLLTEEMGWEAATSPTPGAQSAVQLLWPLLEEVEPLKAQAIARMLQLVQSCRHEKVLTVMPCEMVIR